MCICRVKWQSGWVQDCGVHMREFLTECMSIFMRLCMCARLYGVLIWQRWRRSARSPLHVRKLRKLRKLQVMQTFRYLCRFGCLSVCDRLSSLLLSMYSNTSTCVYLSLSARYFSLMCRCVTFCPNSPVTLCYTNMYRNYTITPWREKMKLRMTKMHGSSSPSPTGWPMCIIVRNHVWQL